MLKHNEVKSDKAEKLQAISWNSGWDYDVTIHKNVMARRKMFETSSVRSSWSMKVNSISLMTNLIETATRIFHSSGPKPMPCSRNIKLKFIYKAYGPVEW